MTNNMDMKDLTWVSKPNVCRCCLAAHGVMDLTGIYVNASGFKEVFVEILRNCLGISLSFNSGTSKLICKDCIADLEVASKFHKQVIEADKFYEYFWNNKNDITKSNLAKDKIKHNLKQEIRDKCDEYDSDTPIANYTNINECNTIIENDFKNIKNVENNSNEIEKNKLTIQDMRIELPRLSNRKRISERKKIILTCGTVLKETTACPFRHHKSWFQCFFCSLDFMEINTLRNHIKEAHNDIDKELKKIRSYPRSLQIDISNLECRKCHLNLTDVDSMKQHLFEKHNKLIYKECIADFKVNSSPFICHLCKMEFHVFRMLTTHLNEHYANCICDVCGKSFLNSKRLKVHKRTHENGVYPCSECGKVLKSKMSKINHMESHSKRVVKCQICFKPMKHYNDRIKHMSEVHNITHKFTCPICNREYNIKHYLATHIRQTHGNKDKKCLECGMAFITNHGLKKHMLKHTGDRPFSCSICCKSYTRSYTLKEHMRVHQNDKRLETPP